MLQKFVDETLEIFREMSGHAGCSPERLDELEREHDGAFPPLYHELMLLDADRLCNTKVFISPERILEYRHEAEHIIKYDEFGFTLTKNQCVFAWQSIDAFFFFEMIGDDSVPVNGVNYCGGFDTTDGNKYGTPHTIAPSVPDFFAQVLRSYLGLTP